MEIELERCTAALNRPFSQRSHRSQASPPTSLGSEGMGEEVMRRLSMGGLDSDDEHQPGGEDDEVASLVLRGSRDGGEEEEEGVDGVLVLKQAGESVDDDLVNKEYELRGQPSPSPTLRQAHGLHRSHASGSVTPPCDDEAGSSHGEQALLQGLRRRMKWLEDENRKLQEQLSLQMMLDPLRLFKDARGGSDDDDEDEGADDVLDLDRSYSPSGLTPKTAPDSLATGAGSASPSSSAPPAVAPWSLDRRNTTAL